MVEQIKKIRKQYDFPIWLIKEALEYYDGDEAKASNRLIEIYNVIGDNPRAVIDRNIERFVIEISRSRHENKE